MKKFIITCDTNWCGTESQYRALAESDIELDELAYELAYDNFCSLCDTSDILEDLGYNSEELTDEEIDEILENIDESMYYFYNIEECDDDDEWNSFGDDYIYTVSKEENG